MATRTQTLTGTFANAADVPYTSIPISCYLSTPGGLDVLDQEGRILSNGTRYGVGTVSDGTTGAFSLVAVYVGDLTAADGSPTKCQLVITGAGRMVESPYAGYVYASSIAISTWLPSASTTGTLVMGLGADDVSNTPLQHLMLGVDITITAVKPDGRTFFAGNPISVATDASGNIAVPLVPTSLLDPSTARYKLALPGSTWYFGAPVNPTGYQGAWGSGTTYHVNAGTLASPSDVVVRSGTLYQSIADGINHDPVSSPSYWQVWQYEPIIWHRTLVAVTGATVITTSNLAPSSNIALEPSDPVQTILTLDNQLQNISSRTIFGNLSVRTVTTTFTATNSDDVILVDATSGNVAGTIPTAIGQYKPITIIKIDTSGHTVTLTPSTGGQTIDVGSALVLSAFGAAATLVSDQANWWSPAGAGAGSFLPAGAMPYYTTPWGRQTLGALHYFP